MGKNYKATTLVTLEFLFILGALATNLLPLDVFTNQANNNVLKKDKSESYVKTKAKNVVLITVEGLDQHTLAVARELVKADSIIKMEFDTILDFIQGSIKMESRDFLVADVAAATSALFNGVPEHNGQMGWVEQLEAKCTAFKADLKKYPSLFKAMNTAGKLTGLITSGRLTEPGVGGMYATSPDMNIQSDTDLTPAGCGGGGFLDIAAQLIQNNKFINLIIGGGRENFLNKETIDPVTKAKLPNGRSGLALPTYWVMDKTMQGKTQANKIGNEEVLKELPKFTTTDYFLGLMDETTLKDSQFLRATFGVLGSLKAKKHANGYFLVIHYDKFAAEHKKGTLTGLGEAYKTLLTLVQQIKGAATPDTLVVLASTEGSTLTLASGMSHDQNFKVAGTTEKCQAYTFANYQFGTQHANPITDIGKAGFVYSAKDPSAEITGGSDLPVFANGPSAHVFRGMQNYQDLYNGLLYAVCADKRYEALKHCVVPPTTTVAPTTTTTTTPSTTTGSTPPSKPTTTTTTTKAPPVQLPFDPKNLPKQPLPQRSQNPYNSLGLGNLILNQLPNTNPNLNTNTNTNTNANSNAWPFASLFGLFS